MKKVLFGIMALSVAAFALNPGVTNPDGTETASVPVKVIAEIIKAPTGLTITDEAGTVLDELLIDHGRIVADTAGDDSVAFKIFKVKRFDSTTGAIDILDPINTDGAKLKASLDNAATILALNGDPTVSKLESTLTLTGGTNPIDGISYDHIVAEGEKEHVGRVTSRIARSELYADTNAGGSLETGIHHNSRERTLTVVYTPN